MGKIRHLNLFLAGFAFTLFGLYGGMVIQRAWLQAQHDAMTVRVVEY